jgi:hypothetical protein
MTRSGACKHRLATFCLKSSRTGCRRASGFGWTATPASIPRTWPSTQYGRAARIREDHFSGGRPVRQSGFLRSRRAGVRKTLLICRAQTEKYHLGSSPKTMCFPGKVYEVRSAMMPFAGQDLAKLFPQQESQTLVSAAPDQRTSPICLCELEPGTPRERLLIWPSGTKGCRRPV